MDQDHTALQAATQRLAPFGDQFCALHGNFRHFPDILSEIGISGLDGILVDLGVSSHQLDEPERGFSFQKDGPLDLRMDPSSGRPASDIINSASVGEENRAWQLANVIAKARVSRPITRTLELSDLIARHSPTRGKRNPATLIFQALRIAVNDELSALQDLLQSAPRWLKPGGRLAIITFHSLEDRIAKHTLHFLATPELDRPEWPAPRPNPEHCLRLLSRKPIDPTPEEIARNPRSRSARLRAAERL
jgi:16S rRNA (cytosine1402-N4)-methyltransferase